MALLADYFLAPALMVLVNKKRPVNANPQPAAGYRQIQE
jgi:hypothetical protein